MGCEEDVPVSRCQRFIGILLQEHRATKALWDRRVFDATVLVDGRTFGRRGVLHSNKLGAQCRMQKFDCGLVVIVSFWCSFAAVHDYMHGLGVHDVVGRVGGHVRVV